jgi:chromosome transmission fidelity protein 18
MTQILLLSGPPGLGKTTLAQIVANQAGYEVLEINARYVSSSRRTSYSWLLSDWYTSLSSSDDRNATTVTSRIQNALDSGSKFASKKPTLIVIDEIDGATGGGDQVSAHIR